MFANEGYMYTCSLRHIFLRLLDYHTDGRVREREILPASTTFSCRNSFSMYTPVQVKTFLSTRPSLLDFGFGGTFAAQD